MIKHTWLLMAALGLLLAGGCSRALTEGIATVTGPKGVAVVIQPVSRQARDVSLEDYTQFRMEPFTDAFGRTPRSLLTMLPGDFSRALASNKIYNRHGGKTLIVRGQIVHYEEAKGMTSQVFGPFEEVVARVELVDAGTGKVLGVANCIGRSNATKTEGVRNKTEGLAKGIASWIAQHYPKGE